MRAARAVTTLALGGPRPPPSMAYRKLSRTLLTPDGTALSWHTHLGSEPGEDDRPLADRPAVVLTNGIGTSENFWRHLVEVLSPTYRVVHWDYRGHGDSGTAPTGDYAFARHVEDLQLVTETVIATSRHRRPPVHIAFSMGVGVVLELYRTRPDLFPSMVLIGGSPDAPFSAFFPLANPRIRRALQDAMGAMIPVVPLAARPIKAFLRSPLAYPAGRLTGLLRRRAPREDIAQFLGAMCKMDPLAWWKTAIGLTGAHASDVLPRVDVPVLIIGARNDLLMPLRQVEQLAASLPHARFIIVDDAGHAGLVEAGAELAVEVHRFLLQQPPP